LFRLQERVGKGLSIQLKNRVPFQGCQMVCFQTQNPNLGKSWGVLQWKMLLYFMPIWSIFRPLEIFYDHLVKFVVICYIFPRFGMLCQENLATLFHPFFYFTR
jgi:hypothetical protein